MSQHNTHHPFFSAADDMQDTNTLLYLQATDLIARCNSWKALDSLMALRTALESFKQELHSTPHELYDVPEEDSRIYKKHDLYSELDQIAASFTFERAIYYIDRLKKSISEIRTSSINDINLNRWKEYKDIHTDSLWLVDRRDDSGVHSAGYWGNFIPQIPNQMIRRYTKQGEWVLDTFAGSGTTLIEGQRLGRHTIGIELQDSMVNHTKQLIAAEQNNYHVTVDIRQGDSATCDYKQLLRTYQRESVQLVLMHPPYFDIIKFSDDERDLSNAQSVDDFLAMMGNVIDNAAHVLDKGRYLVIVIGDKYAKGDWIPLGFQTMNEALRRGFSLKSIVVKNFEDTSGKRNQKELWRYRALAGGFYIFKHEYLFVLKKK